MNSFRVIILGSNPATRLSLIRCVGAIEGCRVTVINMVSELPERPYRTIDTYSKYVDYWFFAKKFDEDGLAKVLLEKCRVDGEKPLLLSVDDDSASLIDRIQDQIKKHFCFSNINNKAGAISELMDKVLQKNLAKQMGFQVVESWVAECIDGEYTIPVGVKYPCYVKGRLSYHSVKQYQKKCNSEVELVNWLRIVAQKNPSPLLIEEFIAIDKEYGVIGYCDKKKVVLPGIVELLDGGHGGHKGVSAFGQVNDFGFNTGLKPKIEELMKNIQLTGMFNIDFVESKGQWYFVELNFRFAAYGFAVCEAGANLPAFQIHSMYSKDDGALNTQVTNGFCYVNEKVAFDDVVHGFRSWKNYITLVKKADCCLVNQKKDPQPYRHFKNGMLIAYFRYRIKKYFVKKHNC